MAAPSATSTRTTARTLARSTTRGAWRNGRLGALWLEPTEVPRTLAGPLALLSDALHIGAWGLLGGTIMLGSCGLGVRWPLMAYRIVPAFLTIAGIGPLPHVRIQVRLVDRIGRRRPLPHVGVRVRGEQRVPRGSSIARRIHLGPATKLLHIGPLTVGAEDVASRIREVVQAGRSFLTMAPIDGPRT